MSDDASLNERIFDQLRSDGHGILADEYSTSQPDFSLVAVTQEEMWQYLDCDQCGERLCQVEANDTLDVLISVARDHLDACAGPTWTTKKEN
jgi:hypothetical protein